MVIRTTAWPAGTPCWLDVSTDVDRAMAFYGTVFGWKFEIGGPEVGGYAMASKDGHVVAGVGPRQDPDQPSLWTTYLATDDVDASAKAIAEAGGQVSYGPVDVMDKGRIAIALDPQGAVFGLWQAGTNTGVDLANEPGSLVWNEHMSEQFDAAKEFYAAVFGYTYQDVEGAEGKYCTVHAPGASDPVAGMGAGGGPAWSAYLQVEDTDAAITTITGLGGSVLTPAEDTPFGRMAVVADDQGTPFSIIGTPSA
ncbi:VOC family protein [Actinokineospora sp. 24-640]